MRVCFTNGCFDLPHAGHVRLINFCRGLGKVIVGLNTDISVRFLKGPGRPVVPYYRRKEFLLSLGVSEVIPVDDDTLEDIISEVGPDFLVKGSDTKVVKGADIVLARGGEVIKCPRDPMGPSSTEIARRLGLPVVARRFSKRGQHYIVTESGRCYVWDGGHWRENHEMDPEDNKYGI